MSSRAIAPVVGANHNTVARDLAGVSNETPDAEPRTKTGLDGKTYTAQPRPEPEPVTAELESDLQIANDTPHVYGLDALYDIV